MSTASQKKSSQQQPQCRRHSGELITVYSNKFEKCMCLKCAMEKHDLLSDFMPISEGAEMLKSVGKVLQDEITQMTESAKMLKRDRTRLLEKMHASDKNIRGQIRKMRDKINRHLDLIEQKLTNKLKLLVEKSDKTYMKDQNDTSTLEGDLKKMKEKLAVCLKTGGDMELISGVVHEKSVFQSKKLEIRDQQERMPTKSLQFKISNAILDFVENVQEFGEVSLQMPTDHYDEFFDSTPPPQIHRPQHVPGHPRRNTYAGSVTPLSFKNHDSPRNFVSRYPDSRIKNKYGLHVSNPYHSFHAQFQKMSNDVNVAYRDEYGDEFMDPYNDLDGVRDDPIILGSDHDGPCNLSGVAALTSGRVVVCDSKHKCLQLINRRSEVLDELVFHYKPCDIAVVAENSIIVSFVEKDFISEFSVSNHALSHKRDLTVSGRGGSYSIAFNKNKFAVCRRGEIRVLSSGDGTLISKLQIQAHFPQIAMSDGGSRIFLSDFVGGKVLCMNELGKVKWEYSQEDLEPSGLAVDLNQLFIADVKGKILIMSTYGILVRELQCFGRLQAICVDPNTGTVLVTQENNKDKSKSRSIKVVSI